MKKLTLLIVFLSLCTALFTQEVLMEEEVGLPVREEFGPNGKRFSHFFMGWGNAVGKGEFPGAEIRYGYSSEIQFGYRYKQRISGVFSGGYELTYIRTSYEMKQEPGKVFPNDRLHDREWLIMHQGGLGLYFRLNFSERGDYMGSFFDIGAYGNYILDGKHVVKDTVTDPAFEATSSRTTYRKLEYLNNYNYGLMTRLGWNRSIIQAQYRLSDIFSENFPGYPEFSRWTIVFQVGLH